MLTNIEFAIQYYICSVKKRVQNDEERNYKRNKSTRFFADVMITGLPFVRVAEGVFEGLVLLIDTGSNDNIMFGCAHKELKEMFVAVESTSSLYGIDGKKTDVSHTRGKFSFCGKEHEMEFLVREDDEAAKHLAEDMGFQIARIIGTKFMVEHGWVLDFAQQEIMIPNTDVSVGDLLKLKSRK